MRLFYVFIAVTLMLGQALVAEAETSRTEAACQSLDRPNIDCGCVQRRIQTFTRIAPNDQAKALVSEGYLYNLGEDNSYEQQLETTLQDPMAFVATVQAFDTVGGRPENIDDYERACVIAGAPRPPITPAPSWDSVDAYIDQCTVSTNDRRSCTCTAERVSSYLTEREFEAYYRSFADYSDDAVTSHEEMNKARGKAMGISGDAFEQLQSQARSKFKPFEDRDGRYCAAMTSADQTQGSSAEERELAGFEEGTAMILSPTASPEPTESDLTGLAQTREIARQACGSAGNSAQYCQCYMADFESKIVAVSPSDNATRAWVLMTAGSEMEPTTYMEMVQAVPQSDHQAAAMLMIQASDVGETCTQGLASEVTPLSGTPYDRMMHICIADNEDEALCECTVSQLQSKLSEDDFELIVDVREAEFNGADDPLAVVAEDRGMTGAEAEEALAMNMAMISGVMSMNMMSCFGGMSGMPSIPGMPQQ